MKKINEKRRLRLKNNVQNKLYFYRIYIQILKEQARKIKYKNYKKLIKDVQLEFEKIILKWINQKEETFIERWLFYIFTRRQNEIILDYRLQKWLSSYLTNAETKLILLDLYVMFTKINPLNKTYYEKIRKGGIKWKLMK